MLDRLPTLPGPPFLGSTQTRRLIRVLLIGRAALHLLRSTDLAWPSFSGLPSTDAKGAAHEWSRPASAVDYALC